MMTSIDHGRLVRGLIPALVEAGRIEMAYFQAGVVEHKSDRSPVTVADREAEACLLQALGELSPGVPVVAEEEVAEGRVPELGLCSFWSIRWMARGSSSQAGRSSPSTSVW